MTNILNIYYDLEQKKDLLQTPTAFFLSTIQSLSPEEVWKLLLDKEILSQTYEKEMQEAPQKFLSVEEFVTHWEDKKKVRCKTTSDEDLLRICLITLWQNYNPQNPCLELFEFFVQRGYSSISFHKEEQALQEWRRAGEIFLYASQKLYVHGMCSLREVLEQQYEIDVWIQDYLSALLETYDLVDLGTMRHFATEFLQLFHKEDDATVQSVKISYAQSFSIHQEYKKCDALYEEWVQKTPTWVRGWISWSDTYWIYEDGSKDETKAIFILKNALNQISFPNRTIVLMRLQLLYEKKGLAESARLLAEEIEDAQIKQQPEKTIQMDPLIEKLMQECELTEDDFSTKNF